MPKGFKSKHDMDTVQDKEGTCDSHDMDTVQDKEGTWDSHNSIIDPEYCIDSEMPPLLPATPTKSPRNRIAPNLADPVVLRLDSILGKTAEEKNEGRNTAPSTKAMVIDLGSSAQSDYNANDALDQYEENDFVVNDAQEAGNDGSRVIQQQYLQSQWTEENDIDDRRSYNTLSIRKILLRKDYPTREQSQTILLNIKQNLLIHLVKRRAEKAGKKVIHRHT